MACNSLREIGCDKCPKKTIIPYMHAIKLLSRDIDDNNKICYSLDCVAFISGQGFRINGKEEFAFNLIPVCSNNIKKFSSLEEFWLYYNVADTPNIKVLMDSSKYIFTGHFKDVDDLENQLITIGVELNSLGDLKFFMENDLAKL